MNSLSWQPSCFLPTVPPSLPSCSRRRHIWQRWGCDVGLGGCLAAHTCSLQHRCRVPNPPQPRSQHGKPRGPEPLPGLRAGGCRSPGRRVRLEPAAGTAMGPKRPKAAAAAAAASRPEAKSWEAALVAAALEEVKEAPRGTRGSPSGARGWCGGALSPPRCPPPTREQPLPSPRRGGCQVGAGSELFL